MVGSIHPSALCLILSLCPVAGLAARADDAPVPRAEEEAPIGGSLYDVPGPFVPLHPRTVDDRRQIEALQAYTAARALEDRRMLTDAIDLLEQALKKEPESVAILRRLSRLSFAAGRLEPAVAYSRKVIEADPNDTTTIHRLVRYFEVRKDLAGAEALLTGILANPELDKKSPAYLLAEHDLGMIYREQLRRMDRSDPRFGPLLEKAADAFAKLLDELDAKEVSRLSPADQRRILGDEAESYLAFGIVLLEAGRHDLAIKAFRRGLVYDADQPQLNLQLGLALLKAGKNEEALATAEALVKQQPRQREAYDLLAQGLSATKRKAEIIPRLEAAAKADPKNRAVQYALAERYGEAGQREKANALFEALRASPPDAQDFGALAAWLRKEKRGDELLKLLGDAVVRPGGLQSVLPQIEAIANDPAYAEELLDAGLKMMAADPPTLNGSARRILGNIAGRVKNLDKLADLLRLAIKKDPTPQDYSDLADTLSRLNRFDEVAATVEELLAKYPNLRNPRVLVTLGRNRLRAGKKEAAVDAFREAQKLEPNDPETLYYLSLGLSNIGKDDEAIETVRGVLKADQANPDFNRLLGLILTQAGREDQAIAHYNGLIERFAANDELVKLARSGLSAIYVAREDFAKGEAELELLLEKDPDDPGVNNDLGYLYADQGKELEKAEGMIRKALADDPENSAYLDSLGWVLFKRGKVKDAVEELEKAVASPNGTDVTIHDHLGDAYFRLHEYAKARASWERAAKLASEARLPDKRLPEIRKKLESLKELDAAPRTSTGETP